MQPWKIPKKQDVRIILSGRNSENKTLNSNKEKNSLVKKLAEFWTKEIEHESLILAQDERWRRA